MLQSRTFVVVPVRLSTGHRERPASRPALRLMLSLLPVLFHTAGCAGGPKFSAVSTTPADKAQLYVYRDPGIVGSAGVHTILVNDVRVASLSQGTYFPYQVEPGPVTLKMDLAATPFMMLAGALEGPRKVLEFEAVAGKTYYLAFKLGGLTSGPKLIPVPEEKASNSIRACRLAKVHKQAASS